MLNRKNTEINDDLVTLYDDEVDAAVAMSRAGGGGDYQQPLTGAGGYDGSNGSLLMTFLHN